MNNEKIVASYAKLSRAIRVGMLFNVAVIGVVAFGAMAFGRVAWAVPPVEVVALFKDRLVVRDTGGQVMLRPGQSSPSGMTLLRADTASATVTYQGEQFVLSLSGRVSSTFSEAKQKTVRMNKDSWGQYQIQGTMNNHSANFLVDTGASVVALSETKAKSMGLDYVAGQTGIMQTAQGTAIAYFLNLDSVTVGSITVHNVAAAVIEGDYPQTVLLGMSFLSNVSMADANGVLSLTATY